MNRKKKNYINFKVIKDTGKTKIWEVRSVHEDHVFLGEVKWYAAWRRYVYVPADNTLYDLDCLNTIGDFIGVQMEKRR